MMREQVCSDCSQQYLLVEGSVLIKYTYKFLILQQTLDLFCFYVNYNIKITQIVIRILYSEAITSGISSFMLSPSSHLDCVAAFSALLGTHPCLRHSTCSVCSIIRCLHIALVHQPRNSLGAENFSFSSLCVSLSLTFCFATNKCSKTKLLN